jgi:nucleoside-diphosphate-sugar epimerase
MIAIDEMKAAANGHDPRETVLVTGGAGYIGSVLVRRLLRCGYRVRVLDSLVYGGEAIQDLVRHPAFELRVGDLRQAAAVMAAATGVDAVIHLGAIVGDPACAIDEGLTVTVNFDATRNVAAACREQGVSRLVFASTCSVYGASDEVLDERSALNPVSTYARTKIASEEVLLTPHNAALAPVILRFATLYGLSPRPRFDLVANVLTAKAVVDGRIPVHGGEQWRPFVHVDDVARALIMAMEAPEAAVAGQVLNVGSNEQNYRLRAVGEIVGELVPTAELAIDPAVVDRRNYYVRFDKIVDALGFVPEHSLRDGIIELKEALDSGRVADYRDERYDNYRSLLSAITPRAA